MFIRDLETSEKFISGDRAVLRELPHPEKSPLAIRYSLAPAVIKPGKKTLPHRLKTSEVYYILSGSGTMHIDSETAKVRSGRADLTFLCIVDPAWRPENEEIL